MAALSSHVRVTGKKRKDSRTELRVNVRWGVFNTQVQATREIVQETLAAGKIAAITGVELPTDERTRLMLQYRERFGHADLLRHSAFQVDIEGG